jgi:hypothetical protein
MKKNKILILALLLQLFIIGSVHARCDLDSLQFGISHKALIDKLKLDAEITEPEIKGAPKQIVYVPGSEACKGEIMFENVTIHFVFIFNKLVGINLMVISESPTLVNWAESTYGVKSNKPSSFYDDIPNALWFWEKSDATISYSIASDGEFIEESIAIITNDYEKYSAELSLEEEGNN